MRPGVLPIISATWLAVLLAAEPRPSSGVTVDGFAEPFRTVNVASTEVGVITAILVSEGQKVHKGQILATLDTDVLQATLDIAKARMASLGALKIAEAERQSARNKLDKLRPLRSEGHASQSELEHAESEVEVAEAKLLAVQEERRIQSLECKRIEVQSERRNIRSPVDGIVVKVVKEIGEALLLNAPEIVSLVELDPLRARFCLPYNLTTRLKVGQEIDVIFPDSGQRARGTLEMIAPVTDPKSATVQMTILIPNPQGLHRSGARCVLEVDFGPAAGGRRTPPKGLHTGPKAD